jgi:hypothetical protein
MESAGIQAAETSQQMQSELQENVQRAKAEFQRATPDNCVATRESYVRALDALNTFLRSEKIPGDT